MSKILFLADIHGNMPAVRALEKEIEKIQPNDVYFLGDVVGKGPENDQAVDWVRKNCKHCLKGNWDDFICQQARKRDYPGMEFFWKQLGEERLQWLDSQPFEDEVLISGQWFRLVHGRPTDRLYFAYDDMDALKEGFQSKVFDRTYQGYITADTHMPHVRECSLGYAINTGSVGNSLGMPRVHALVIDGELGSEELSTVRFEILSIPYDNQAAADAANRYPDLPNLAGYQNEVLTGNYSR